MKSYDLGSEKIGRLVRHFAVPCVISMLVAALYNIVDQIFIGWSSAGAAGNAATNIVYPFTVLALGLALLVGDGEAAMFSLLWAKKTMKGRTGASEADFLFWLFFLFCCARWDFCSRNRFLEFSARIQMKRFATILRTSILR